MFVASVGNLNWRLQLSVLFVICLFIMLYTILPLRNHSILCLLWNTPCRLKKIMVFLYCINWLLSCLEQSLQALKKISQEHPTACLRAGALMAVLSYLDFFSTGVQVHK